MESVSINRSSWHCRLVLYFGSSWCLDDLDLCGYTRKVMGSMLLAALLLAFFGGLLAAWVWVMYSVYRDYGLVGLGIISTLFVLMGTVGLWVERAKKLLKSFKKLDEPVEPPPPGFIKEAYLSWKGKYCKRIEIVD